MKKHLLILFISIFSSLSLSASDLYSSIDLNNNTNYEDYRNFLIRLGFKDYCMEMQESLKSPNLTEVSKRVLEYNIEHYQIINVAREIAAFIFSYSENFHSQENLNHITALSSYLLLPSKDVSTELIDRYSQDKKLSTEESFNVLEKSQMSLEKELIISSIVEITGLKDPAAIDTLDYYLTRYITLKYTDSNLKQTNYLGRAVAANLIRFVRQNHIDSVEENLRRNLLIHKVFLNNYISDTQAFINNKHQIQTVKLHSGDFANEYSKGSEAYFISIGTTPTGIRNRIKASSNHLLGNVYKFVLYPSPDAEKKILAKVSEKKELSSLEKIQYSLIQNKPDVPGYSHVGLVDLKEDAASGIKMSWIWDSYPNDGIGGIRFIGTEGFVFPGEFQKIGFVHYNPTKFLRYYKNQVKTRGYLKDVWLSYSAKIDDGAIAIDNDKEKYAWPTHISESEVRDLTKADESKADAWFKNEIAPRVTSMMEQYFTGTEALAFADGFNNVRGAAYCSQAIVLAYLQGADIDPEVKKDKLSLIVKIGHALKLDELEDIDLTQRIISPAGFAWQSDLVESHIPIMIEQQIDANNTMANTNIILNELDDSTKELISNFELDDFKETEMTLPAAY